MEYKHAIVDYFKSHAKILIVTDAGSEGLNLQFCNTIINYDLPWNPQKIEQRIGRCHRYGQTHDVVAINLLNTDNEADRRVYDILCNGVQREHNKKLNNGLPILHKVPPKRDYGRYFCIMAEKGGTSHGGLTEKLSPFFHAKKQEVNAYGR